MHHERCAYPLLQSPVLLLPQGSTELASINHGGPEKVLEKRVDAGSFLRFEDLTRRNSCITLVQYTVYSIQYSRAIIVTRLTMKLA